MRDEGYQGGIIGSFSIPAVGVTGPILAVINNGDLDYDIDNVFVWGVGFKATYNLPKNWLIGIDARYLRHKNDYDASTLFVETVILGGVGSFMSYESYKGALTNDEWQVAPYIAKKIGNFTPYLGVKYSDLRIKDKSQIGFKYIYANFAGAIRVIDLDSGSYVKKYRADHNVGPFIGLDYNIGKHWKLNIEGRFVDETAMSCNISYKF